MTDPWEEYAKYPVHDESRAFTNALAAYSVKPFNAYTLEEARKTFADIFMSAGGNVNFDGQVQELSIPSPSVADGIPVTVYKPTNVAKTPAIFIYFHGGGLVILNRKCYETALKIIAANAGCIIVNVEYRLLCGPGKGHDPFDDCLTATKWVMEHKETLGGRADSKVGVGGDSAGGQLAASMTNDIRGLDFQILIYPNVDTSLSQPSVEEFANAPGLNKADIKWFMDFVTRELPDHLTDPRVNGMARTNTELSPPALILVAQIDTIRDSGLVYAEKLKAAGVKVRVVVIEGVPHGFFSLVGIFQTKCPEAYGHIAHFIKDFQ